jgi:hypothetical protein
MHTLFLIMHKIYFLANKETQKLVTSNRIDFE